MPCNRCGMKTWWIELLIPGPFGKVHTGEELNQIQHYVPLCPLSVCLTRGLLGQGDTVPSPGPIWDTIWFSNFRKWGNNMSSVSSALSYSSLSNFSVFPLFEDKIIGKDSSKRFFPPLTRNIWAIWLKRQYISVNLYRCSISRWYER